MSDSSVVCPHCAARRKVAPKLQLDRDEVRALLVMEGAAKDDDERDWLATLVLPHPATSGGARGFEIALTIAAFPFVMSGALTFALHRLRGKGRIKMRGEAGPLALMTVFGSLGMWTVLGLAGVSTGSIVGVVAGSIAVLCTRAAVRSRSRAATR